VQSKVQTGHLERSRAFAFHRSDLIEPQPMRSHVVKTDVPSERLPWKHIAVSALVGALIGVVSVWTSQGLDTLPATIASGLIAIGGLGLIGGLWAATFFTTED
jgi:hypothetical protein